MRRLLIELRYFVQQIRGRYPRQTQEKMYRRLIEPLSSYELKKYSFQQCLIAASEINIPKQFLWDLAMMIWIRCNRGLKTLDEIVFELNKHFGSRRRIGSLAVDRYIKGILTMSEPYLILKKWGKKKYLPKDKQLSKIKFRRYDEDVKVNLK